MDTIRNKLITDLKSDDPAKILAALTSIIFSTPDIDPEPVLTLLEHETEEISLSAMQALAVYEGKFNKEIIKEIKNTPSDSLKQSMLFAALAIHPTEEALNYVIELLTGEDEILQETAIEILINYGKITIVPLLSILEHTPEKYLPYIKRVFEGIGKIHVMGILKGIPDLQILDKLLLIFSKEDLEELNKRE